MSGAAAGACVPPEGGERGTDHRAQKERRVRDGEAHAALVFDGDSCVGWCQFGPPDELPRIKFGHAYREVAGDPPDWRITCFFVDRNYRHKGVAAAALKGALQEIARLGGGTVRALPKMSKGARSPTHSCTTPPWGCSSSKGSPAPVNSARTAGWSRRGTGVVPAPADSTVNNAYCISEAGFRQPRLAPSVEGEPALAVG